MRQMGDISSEGRIGDPGVVAPDAAGVPDAAVPDAADVPDAAASATEVGSAPAVDSERPAVLDERSFDRELEAFIARSSSATTWHVERLLKVSDFETTELVEGAPAGGPAGRYVRKRIEAASGAGAAYRALWDAQREGRCPRCVPRLVELGVQGDELTVVMEYVAGSTVGSVVAALGSGPAVAGLVMPQLCHAVAALHSAFDPPLIHRDLKPSNVIMRAGEPVVIDFGSARQWREGAEADTSHFLTRCYAPPEQFGFGQTDARSDVYALGKMLYFCLVGKNPPNVCDAEACERAGICGELAGVICRACAFDPDARYNGAEELAAAIERALERRGVKGEGCSVEGKCRSAKGKGRSAVPVSVARAHAVDRGSVPGERASHEPATCEPAANGRTDSGMTSHDRAPCEQVPDFTWDNKRLSSNLSGRDARTGWQALALGARNLIQRTPWWVSALWNACITLMFAVLVIGSVFAIVSPNAQDARLPLWFRALQYTGVCVVSPGALGYLLLDKRRLRERIAWLARVRGSREVLMALAALILGIMVPLVAGSAAGLI